MRQALGKAMQGSGSARIDVLQRISEIDAATWDSFANPDPSCFDPFLAHAFLAALEDAGTVGRRTGWIPQHLILRSAAGEALGGAPAYLKSHSQGEYVFDHGWAEAYERAGGAYYPKLQIAVPFTPVPGRRFLVRPGAEAEHHEALLAAGIAEMARRHGLSSAHATFLTEGEWRRLARLGYLQRTDQQFHWPNRGYATFDDFLASLSSRKRKMVRREREQALAGGISIEHITGRALTEAHWDAFFSFYMDTGSRKWGRPYLNRRFFSLLGSSMSERCLLVMARRKGRYIAGALNLLGGNCLYGRYWGAIEAHAFLHFEICYYQAIEIAIAMKLARVEAGAQGEHKLSRGYLPTATYSAHWIGDPGFRRAVARYLDEERRAATERREILAEYAPYRRVLSAEDA